MPMGASIVSAAVRIFVKIFQNNKEQDERKRLVRALSAEIARARDELLSGVIELHLSEVRGALDGFIMNMDSYDAEDPHDEERLRALIDDSALFIGTLGRWCDGLSLPNGAGHELSYQAAPLYASLLILRAHAMAERELSYGANEIKDILPSLRLGCERVTTLRNRLQRASDRRFGPIRKQLIGNGESWRYSYTFNGRSFDRFFEWTFEAVDAERTRHQNREFADYPGAGEICEILSSLQSAAGSADYDVALDSSVFDWEYYVARYRDLREHGIDTPAEARNHWLRHGIHEQRQAHRTFSVSEYLAIHDDLAGRFHNDPRGATRHYVTHGVAGGRAGIYLADPRVFDWQRYVGHYEDLRDHGIDTRGEALNHWIRHGVREGRVASAGFNARWYLDNNPDVREHFGASNYEGAITHWLRHGIAENRAGAPS